MNRLTTSRSGNNSRAILNRPCRRSWSRGLGNISSLVVLLSIAGTTTSIGCDLIVRDVTPAKTIFRNSVGWTGGDGVMSAPLPSGKVLWFFGDTFVGIISGGKRVDSVMVHNTAAVQNLTLAQATGDRNTVVYGVAMDNDKPKDLFTPERGHGWFWPGAAAVRKGKLYLFVKHVVASEQAKPPFNFSWDADAVLVVANPEEPPQKWTWHELQLPQTDETHHLGTALCHDNDYLYVYGMKLVDATLSRIKWDSLEAGRLSQWSYFSGITAGAPQWSNDIDDSSSIFDHAASEMSVSRLNNLWLAVYSQDGLGPNIVARCAKNPWGPWGDERRIYQADKTAGLLCYGAKAHPELSVRPGELVITYCLNCGDLGKHFERPDIYFPRMVKIIIGAKTGSP